MDDADEGLSRRAVLRRGAALGGALVWTVPVVQSVTPAAFAVGSPAVRGVKRSRSEVAGDKGGLADTGNEFPTVQALAAGTALVAGGAAMAARSRRPTPALPDGATDGSDDATPTDATPTDASTPSPGELT